MIENEKEYWRLFELRNSIYNAEDEIDGKYKAGMYGDKYQEVDELHTELLEILRNYDELLDNTLK